MATLMRFQRLGFDKNYFSSIETFRNSIEQAQKLRDVPGRLTDFARSVESSRRFLTKLIYLYDDVNGTIDISKDYLISAEYRLLGDWQNMVPVRRGQPAVPEEWRQGITWHDTVRCSLMCGGSLGDWESLKRIAEFLTPTIKPAPTAEERDYFVTVGRLLRNEPEDEVLAGLARTIAGRSKPLRLQAEALSAALRKDQAGFDSAFAAYLKRWKQGEWKLDWGLCPEGTFLYHFARKRGLKPTIPDGFDDHIVQLGV